MKVTTLNIQAAGLARAKQLLAWLDGRDDDVVILSETSGGPGTTHLLGQCQAAGWSVVAHPPSGDRGCAVIARRSLHPADDLTAAISARGRVAGCRLDTQPAVTVLGLYVPSNDRTPAKAAKKREFLTSVTTTLSTLSADARAHLIVGGDYNLITRDHVPAYAGVFTADDYAFLDALAQLGLIDAHRHLHPTDQPHSWVGHGGNGYRYDYLHLGTALVPTLLSSTYLDETRTGGLSDHAAVSVELQVAEDPGRIAIGTLTSAGALF